jgi:hypothetical protein
MTLPEDEYSLLLLGWCGTPAHGTAYPDANHRGLFRMALAVDEVAAARAELDPDLLHRIDDPVWCEMPGTPLGGLKVQFLKDPDGVTVELVERPRAAFTADHR